MFNKQNLINKTRVEDVSAHVSRYLLMMWDIVCHAGLFLTQSRNRNKK